MRRSLHALRDLRIPDEPRLSHDQTAATVYSQVWTHTSGSNQIAFDVLALDADMAITLGGMRLSAMGNDARDFWCVSMPGPDAFIGRVAAVVLAEDASERNEREDTWALRNEGPEEADLNGRSASEVYHEAAALDRRLRS